MHYAYTALYTLITIIVAQMSYIRIDVKQTSEVQILIFLSLTYTLLFVQLISGALQCGAAVAVGVDVDVDALASARRNCQLNGYGPDQVQLFHIAGPTEAVAEAVETTEETTTAAGQVFGSESQEVGSFNPQFLPAEAGLKGRQFDLVVANILAPVLIQLAARLAELTAPGGRIALSGVLDFQAAAVIATYCAHFDQVRVEEQRDGWVLITAVKRQCLM